MTPSFCRRVCAWIGRPLLAVWILAGCQTAQHFPTPAASWQTYTGQMHYGGGKRSVVGDVVVRLSSGTDFQLAFSAGPGLPLMRLWESGGSARTEGGLSRGAWQGDTGRVPEHLRAWVALREVFASVPEQGGRFSGRFGSAEAQVVGGRLQHLTVSATNGDRFTFHFGS